jgi:hypothetical protein
MQALEKVEVERCRLWRLPAFVDSRGRLVLVELATTPFPVQRVFFVSDVPANKSRGGHAKKSGEEFLIPIKGSVAVSIDDGVRRAEITLRDPCLGLIVGPRIWCAQSRFSDDAVLGVFASQPYKAEDHIDDYAEFRAMACVR